MLSIHDAELFSSLEIYPFFVLHLMPFQTPIHLISVKRMHGIDCLPFGYCHRISTSARNLKREEKEEEEKEKEKGVGDQ